MREILIESFQVFFKKLNEIATHKHLDGVVEVVVFMMCTRLLQKQMPYIYFHKN